MKQDPVPGTPAAEIGLVVRWVTGWRDEGTLAASAADAVIARAHRAAAEGAQRPSRPGARPRTSGADDRPRPSAPTRPRLARAAGRRGLDADAAIRLLLALGTFLVLSAGAVISLLNPTHLAPALHLGAAAGTLAVFCAVGEVVRARLGLTRAGTVLWLIGGAFVPLLVATAAQPALLGWSSATTFLVASAVATAAYLLVHAHLRERITAAATAVAALSLLGAAGWFFGAPWEWIACAIVAAAGPFSAGAVWLRARAPLLARALDVTARLAAVGAVATLSVWRALAALDVAGRPDRLFLARTGVEWWCLAGAAALAWAAGRRAVDAHALAWALGVASVGTMLQLPLDDQSGSVVLALVAVGFAAVGRGRRHPATPVGLALGVLACAVPSLGGDGTIVALLILATTQAALAAVARRPVYLYAAAPAATAAYLLGLNRLFPDAPPPAIDLLTLPAAALLLGGLALRRVSAPGDRPDGSFDATLRHRAWATPLLDVGAATALLAAASAVSNERVGTLVVLAALLAAIATGWAARSRPGSARGRARRGRAGDGAAGTAVRGPAGLVGAGRRGRGAGGRACARSPWPRARVWAGPAGMAALAASALAAATALSPTGRF